MTETTGEKQASSAQRPKVTVIGTDGQPLRSHARERLANASLVVGGVRHLDALAPRGVRRLEITGDLEPVLAEIEATHDGVCVLASGDPGFFGIVRLLGERFGGSSLEVIPAVSAVSEAFARVGLSWDDAVIVSAHGRSPNAAVNAARAHPKVAVLTSPQFGPSELAGELCDLERALIVCERLGEPGERITRLQPGAAARQTFSNPNVVLCLDETRRSTAKQTLWPARGPMRWALSEETFDHRDGMVTKAEVRAQVLAHLGPGLGDLVWDIGSGSGSVAVECARFGAAVIAIDTDPIACQRVSANAAAHEATVSVVCGRAPQALVELPDPDCVFVGGGGGDLEPVLSQGAARRPRAIVATLATLERVGPTLSVLEGAGYEVEATMVNASRLRGLGKQSRLAAINPVFVVAGHRSG